MTKHFSDDAAIERLVRGFMDHALPKQEWTHAAHFAATLWLLRHRPDPAVETQMPTLIRTYNESVGGQNTDTSGYHETITQASIHEARAFLKRQPADLPLHEAVDRLMDSPLGHPDWLLVYWSRAQLFSPQARRAWMEPDLRPLP